MWDTQLGLNQATDMHDRLDSASADEVVAVIRKPWAKDAQGQPVATSLTPSGSNTITMSLPPLPQVLAQPVTANLQVSSVSGSEQADTAADFGDAEPWDEDQELAFETAASPPDGEPPVEPTPNQEAALSDEDLSGDYPDDLGSFSEPVVLPDGENAAFPDGSATDSTTVAAATSPENLANLNVGISDSNASLLRSNRYKGLGSGNPSGKTFLRVFVPWNYLGIRRRVYQRIQDGEETKACARRAVARWDGTADKPGYRQLAKAAAQQGGVGVMVVFSSQAQSTGDSNCKQKAPPAARYKKEIKAFLSENRFVHRVTAWNEPNFTKSRTASNPRRAARYWKRASAVCRRTRWCVEVPAGAFAGLSGASKNFPIRIKTRNRGVVTRNVGYLRAYKAEISRGDYGNKRKNWPRIWAFHAWSDWRVYSAGRSSRRTEANETRQFRTIFSQQGKINGRGPYRLVDDYRYDADPGSGFNEVRPRVWVTEAGALYRLACSKIQTKRANSKPCKRANGTTDEAGTLIFGRRRQAQAAAFILKSLTRPLRVGDPPTPATPVRRLYYYNHQDTAGFKYKLRGKGAGFSGRCTTRVDVEDGPTLVRCDRDDSGVIGSMADGRSGEEGYTRYSFRPAPIEPGRSTRGTLLAQRQNA